MKVLMIHSFYAQQGGEDLTVQARIRLLRERGVEVVEFTANNGSALKRGKLAAVGALGRSAFNKRVYEEVRKVCSRVQPDVAHVHNFWFTLSPAVHSGCQAERIPTVQTLGNYRFFCLNGLLMRNSRPCEACLNKIPWRGVVRRCYNGSAFQSAAVAHMIIRNRLRDTWNRDVTIFVARTKFAKAKLTEAGLDPNKMVIKPNFVDDPGPVVPPSDGAVYMGRLSPEKGIITLFEAWAGIPDVPLQVFGNGPLKTDLTTKVAERRMAKVTMKGLQPKDVCLDALQRAGFLLVPSECYEMFPGAIIDAFALGRPVVASRSGSIPEIVEDGRTGLLFEPGNPDDLKRKVNSMIADPANMKTMGVAARREYENRYAPGPYFESLLAVYERAMSINEQRSEKA